MLPVEFRTTLSLREFLITGGAGAQTTLLALIVYFVLSILAAGSGAPGGLFAPTLVLGAALGNLVGLWQFHLLAIGDPTTYALTGMGALFCVVYKAPITAIIIIFEITRDFNLVLPLMVGSVIAYLVAETLDPGSLYDKIDELNGIQLKQLDSDPLLTLQVAHVMPRRPLETLTSDQTLDEVREAFNRTRRHCFPVLENDKLVGVVTQTDLTRLFRLPSDPETPPFTGEPPLREFMTPQPITISPENNLSEVVDLLNKYNLSR